MPLASRITVRLLMASACSGMFVFGLVMALLGAVLPSLAGRLQFTVADIGALFLVMNFAMLVCCLVLGMAMDRYGMKPPLAVGPLLVAAALLLITRAGSFAGLYPAVALLGLGGGALNGAANTLTADLHDDQQHKGAALNRVGVFFGFGALLLPFLIGSLLARFGLNMLLFAAAAIAAGAGVFAAFLRFPVPKQAAQLRPVDLSRLLRAPLLLLLGALMFCESGVEFTLGGFLSTYVTRELGPASVSLTSWILASYWLAVMVARVPLSRLALVWDPFRILSMCAGGALAGALIIAAAPGLGLATLGIVLTGFSLSGVFPTVMGIAGARFESRSGTAIGLLLATSLTGGMIVPWLSSQIAAAAGLRWAFAGVAVAFAAILILSRMARRAGRSDRTSTRKRVVFEPAEIPTGGSR